MWTAKRRQRTGRRLLSDEQYSSAHLCCTWSNLRFSPSRPNHNIISLYNVQTLILYFLKIREMILFHKGDQVQLLSPEWQGTIAIVNEDVLHSADLQGDAGGRVQVQVVLSGGEIIKVNSEDLRSYRRTVQDLRMSTLTSLKCTSSVKGRVAFCPRNLNVFAALTINEANHTIIASIYDVSSDNSLQTIEVDPMDDFQNLNQGMLPRFRQDLKDFVKYTGTANCITFCEANPAIIATTTYSVKLWDINTCAKNTI